MPLRLRELQNTRNKGNQTVAGVNYSSYLWVYTKNTTMENTLNSRINYRQQLKRRLSFPIGNREPRVFKNATLSMCVHELEVLMVSEKTMRKPSIFAFTKKHFPHLANQFPKHAF